VKTKLREHRPLDRHSPIPLYQQLSDLLAEAIRTGQLTRGEQLPSENELIDRFSVSRFVVRQTLNNLGRQGLIYTEQGRGSFVAARKIVKPLDILQSYHAGMKKAGIDVDVRIIQKAIVTPPEDIARQLALKRNDKVILLERVAYADQAPLNLLISHIALGPHDRTLLAHFEGGSLYDFLATECGIQLKSSHNNIEITFSGEEESRLLNWSRGSVLLEISGVSYDQNGKPVEHSRVVYPGSMFRFQFDSFKANAITESGQLVIG
jgi:DNA-binding GntR family transcriptional regulator